MNNKIYRVQIEKQPVVVLGSSDIAETFYKSQISHRSLNKLSFFGHAPETVLSRCIAFINDKDFQKARRSHKTLFLHNALEQNFDIVRQEVAGWSKEHIIDGRNIDFSQCNIEDLPLTILARIVYGHYLSEEEFQQILNFGRDHLAISTKSAIRDTDTLDLSWKEFTEKWFDFNERKLKQILETKKKGSETFLVADHKSFSMFLGKLDQMFYSIVDATCGTLKSAITYLSANSVVREKLFSEIRKTLDKEVDLSWDTLSTLPYMNAVVKESHRLRIPLIKFVPCISAEPISFGVGDDVPSGTAIAIDISKINRDPSSWKNPERFEPSRYLNSDGSDLEAEFFDFGLNVKRICFGMSFAEAIVKLALYEILSHYKIETAEDNVKVTALKEQSLGLGSIVRLDDGIMPCFAKGQKALNERGHVFFGMCFGNSYYSEERLCMLIPFLASKFSRVFIDVPGMWAKSTYEAQGYTEGQIKSKLTYLMKRLQKHCRKAVDLACNNGVATRDQFYFMEWDRDVEPLESYQYVYSKVRETYETDPIFQRDCREKTATKLKKTGQWSEKTPEEQAKAIDIGVTYVHKELSQLIVFGNTAVKLTNDESARLVPSCEVYHQGCSFFETIFSGQYENKIFEELLQAHSPNFGFLIFEARPSHDTSSKDWKDWK